MDPGKLVKTFKLLGVDEYDYSDCRGFARGIRMA